MCTSAGWAETLTAITFDDRRDCEDADPESGNPGNCGNYMAGVAFMIMYLVLSFLIIVNMYIAVILENYSQATEDVQEGIVDEDYDLFYEIWQVGPPTPFFFFNSCYAYISLVFALCFMGAAVLQRGYYVLATASPKCSQIVIRF